MIDPAANRPEPLPLPTWKIPPRLKWILYPVLAFPLTIPVLFVAASILGFLANRADHTHGEPVDYAAVLGQTERNLRGCFRDGPDRSALTLDEMTARGLLSATDAHFFARYPHEFIPFTPQTSDDAVVLTVQGNGREPDRFTKRDLTADPAAPDHLPAPSPASPAP